ncbi:MAG: hypothetical protein FWE70_08620, partial [Oscillospiraceae bacterium]|nr:hypothetical protein [Oscillospiraceae bacterium]
RTIHTDVANLRARGLNGVVNCQQQRVFADMSLPMYVYAATLLQPDRSFDEIVGGFFSEAFSPANGPRFRAFFEGLTAASEVMRLGGRGGPEGEGNGPEGDGSGPEGDGNGPEGDGGGAGGPGDGGDGAGRGGARRAEAYGALAKAMEGPVPEYECGDIGVAESVRLLRFSMAMYGHLARVAAARLAGDAGKAEGAAEAARAFAARSAAQFESAFDYNALVRHIDGMFVKKAKPS